MRAENWLLPLFSPGITQTTWPLPLGDRAGHARNFTPFSVDFRHQFFR